MTKCLIVAVAMLVTAAGPSAASEVFTLYRSSVIPGGDAARVHVATFDAGEMGDDYNLENCLIAAGLFAGQPGVSVRYWCEAGRYRP